MKIRICSAILALTVAAFAANARAGECRPLTLIASIDFTLRNDDLAILVPVNIQGTPETMLLDTGGVLSTIAPRIADEMKLHRRKSGVIMYGVAGNRLDQYVHVDSFALGALHASSVPFMVDSGDSTDDPAIAGTIAPNILSNYDVELDFGAKKLNLLSQDHCKGKVVYWPASAIAQVPMRIASSGHIIVPVTLDGRTIDAIIDTGSDSSILNRTNAEGEFNLKMGTPDTPDAGSVPGSETSKIYRHKFTTLSFEGVTISNPVVKIFPDLIRKKIPTSTGGIRPWSEEPYGLSVFIIGMNELRHLHLYIAYKEQMLYITPATP